MDGVRDLNTKTCLRNNRFGIDCCPYFNILRHIRFHLMIINIPSFRGNSTSNTLELVACVCSSTAQQIWERLFENTRVTIIRWSFEVMSRFELYYA